MEGIDVVERIRALLDGCKKAGEPECWHLPVSKADLRALIEMAERAVAEADNQVSAEESRILHRAILASSEIIDEGALHPTRGDWPPFDP